VDPRTLVSSFSASRKMLVLACAPRSARGGQLEATSQDQVPGEEGGCRLRAEMLRAGGVLVDVPDTVSGAGELTEFATFLRGLRDAHAILLACSEQPASCGRGSPPLECREQPLDTLPMLVDFYGREEVPLVVTMAAADNAAAQAGTAHLRCVSERLPPSPSGGNVQVLSLGDGAQRRQLATLLCSLRPLPCEPLRSKCPVLSQYRAIRAQLDSRRPPSPGPRRVNASTADPCQRPGVYDGALSSQATSPSSQQQPPLAAAAATAEGEEATSPPMTAQQVQDSPRSLGGLSLHPKGQWVVMVFGKTGAGKSHLANLLVGRKAFESGDSMASVTKAESVRRAESVDRTLMVLDTIGFGDTKLPPEEVTRSLRDTALEAPSGIDALLFVLKKERVTTAEAQTLLYVTQDLFGKECLPNLYMVVTHAGRLAKDAALRGPWLQEQAAASEQFASILGCLGSRPEQRIAFVENADLGDAEDEDDRARVQQRQQRALSDIRALLECHRAPPYQHGIMTRAGEFHAKRLEEMRAELHARVEAEVREELERDRGVIEEERKQLRAEVEDLKEREEGLQKRFEEEWVSMKTEFESRARELARGDLEPLAQEIVQKTEEKRSGRWCSVM